LRGGGPPCGTELPGGWLKPTRWPSRFTGWPTVSEAGRAHPQIGLCALQTAALVLHYNNRGVDQRPVAVNTDRTRVGEVDRAALLATGLSRRIRNGDFDERAAAPAANRSGLYLQAGCPHPQRGPCIFPFAQSSEQ
jgi:hypothetical protein